MSESDRADGVAADVGVEETPAPGVEPEVTPAPEVEPEVTGEVIEPAPSPVEPDVTDWEALVVERTADLQRLQAEYVNYKKRVDRDRHLSRQAGIEAVVLDLMPVLDSIGLAREHGDVDGGFKMVADELEKVAAKHGLVSFGEVGEEFDPSRHDALMEIPLEGVDVSTTTISQVMQPGYVLRDRVIRPARVAVATPQE